MQTPSFQTHTSPEAREVPTKMFFVFLKPSLFFEVFFLVSVRFMIPKHPPTSAKFQPFLGPFFWVVEGQQSTNFTLNWRIQVEKKRFFDIPTFLFARFLKHLFLSARKMFLFKKLASKESLSFVVTCIKPKGKMHQKTNHYEQVLGSFCVDPNSTFCGRLHFTQKTLTKFQLWKKGKGWES